jgi:hypothetical protein
MGEILKTRQAIRILENSNYFSTCAIWIQGKEGKNPGGIISL